MLPESFETHPDRYAHLRLAVDGHGGLVDLQVVVGEAGSRVR